MDNWGNEDSPSVKYFAPDAAGIARVERAVRRIERLTATPRSIRAHLDATGTLDISADIDRVQCPTFIGRCRGDPTSTGEGSLAAVVDLATLDQRRVAEHLPGRRRECLGAVDHDQQPAGVVEAAVDDVSE